MPNDQQKNATSRQRPVSCQFCRKRKLRCSRTAPCSNCVSRGIICDLVQPVPQPSSASSKSEDPDIVQRLNRLETLLLAQKGEERGKGSQLTDDADSRREFAHLSISPSQIREADMNSEIAWLGSVPLEQQIPSSKITRVQVVFKTCPVGQVAKARASTISELPRCIWLPPYAEAQILLQKFLRIAHHLPHVTHTTSLPSLLDQVYADLSEQRQVQSGRIVLLLSLFAAATHSWVQYDCAYGLYSTSSEANEQTSLWIATAEDVLDIACRSPKVSIEGVQGSILTGFVAAHVDGLHRYRMLFGMSIVLARDLALHRIDHPSNTVMANTAEAEIGRRIWWYLCSSDWVMAARVTGMAEGVYSCSPRQMITKKPLNIHDEEIFDGMSRDGRPLSQPTMVSYLIQSIRLAEISRNMIDRSPLAMANTGGLSHEAVMDIDTEMQAFINDIPAFYSMSESEIMKTYRLGQAQAKNISWHGKIIYFMVYLHRCKLHLPYFARSFEDSTYSSSREIGLKYARLIIQSQLWQENTDIDTATRFKFTALLIGVFMACIVLLMDLTLNPLSPQYEKQREEVYKSFKIIEQAKNESDSTGKFVNSLVHVLRKYNVAPSKPASTFSQAVASGSDRGSTMQQDRPIPATGSEMALDIPETSGTAGYNIAQPSASQTQFGVGDYLDLSMPVEAQLPVEMDEAASYWNDFTQNFEQGIDVGSFDWDSIFLNLDAPFL